MNNKELISERLYKAKKDWVDSNYESEKLEKMTKIILSTVLIEKKRELNGKVSIKELEYLALSSEKYKEHIEKECKAKHKANMDFALVEKIRLEFEEMKLYAMQEMSDRKRLREEYNS